jgi:hypothetical protein
VLIEQPFFSTDPNSMNDYLLKGISSMKRVLWSAAAILALCIPSSNIIAQEAKTIELPAETKMVAHLDLEAMKNSAFGKKFIDLVLERIIDEIGDRAGVDIPEMDEVVNLIGFNPLEEIQTITISATDFEKPETGVLGVVAMKKTVGKMEELLPGLPNYELKTIGEQKVHSISPDGNIRVLLAVPTDSDGNRTLIASANEELLTGQLQRFGNSSSAGAENFSYTPTPGNLLDVRVSEIPTEGLGEGPQTIIAAMLEEVQLQLTEDSDVLKVVVDLKANSQENADQLNQMLQGLVPMLQDAISEFSQDLNVKREGELVTMSISMNSEKVVELIDQQFDAAVGMVEGALGNR